MKIGILLVLLVACIFIPASHSPARELPNGVLDLATVTQLLEKNFQSSEWRPTAHPSVVKELQRYTGTVSGRRFARETLQRMKIFRELIEARLKEYGHPKALLALPFVETGYRNYARTPPPSRGSGLWMFIAPTARRYGLEVSPHLDERLNVSLQTEAAMRLLKDHYQRFGSWDLAILAYNAGEGFVERAIEKAGSRNHWVLIEKGYQNDPGYLARVIAASLIIGYPELVAEEARPSRKF